MNKTFGILIGSIVLSASFGCSKTDTNTSQPIAAKEAIVTTFAGNFYVGSRDGQATGASFAGPGGIAIDAGGNLIVADGNNNKIRKIDTLANATTIAGSGTVGLKDGAANQASFYYPIGVAVDPTGNIFVADEFNSTIRKISPAGIVSNFAGAGSPGFSDGKGLTAMLNYPVGIASDGFGNLYVADQYNDRIRKITANGTVTTIAGNGMNGYADGDAASAKFSLPTGVAVDKEGNVFVADKENNRVRKITPSGIVSTIAGDGKAGSMDGTGTNAEFHGPANICIDPSGNLYVTDFDNNKIRKISTTGVVTTIAGTGVSGRNDGVGSAAEFFNPLGIAIDKKGNLYVSEFSNSTIRKITFQ